MLRKKQVVIGVLFWLLIFGAFVTLAGIGDFVETLSAISWSELALILTAVAIGVVAMGSCLYVICYNIGLGFSWLETVFLNTSVSLAHNLTPFGQAGGVPIGAAIMTRRTDGGYEECLAALSVKDMVSFVPAILVFVFGGGYILVYEQSLPSEVRPFVAAFTGLVVLVCLVAFGLYRYPEFMRRLLTRLAAAVNRVAARLPLLPSLDEDDVDQYVSNFADSIGEIGSDRVTISSASTLATCSFLAQGTLLWITLVAVGVEIPIALAIFIVPVSLLASGLPLPGGSGGVESVQVLTIIAMTGAASTPTITAVVLSRGLVFWTPIVLGTLTLLVFELEERLV